MVTNHLKYYTPLRQILGSKIVKGSLCKHSVILHLKSKCIFWPWMDYKLNVTNMLSSMGSDKCIESVSASISMCAPVSHGDGLFCLSNPDGCTQSTIASSIESVPDIEKKYVHRVYDAIAPHFSSTRFAKWPKVAEFLNSLNPGSVVLDSGCGNGKYLGFNPDCFFLGCDISYPLTKICAEKGHEVLVADAVNLPYRDGFGDAAISIAVLHHLSTESRRRKAITELVRTVRKGGLVLITVWAVEQEDKSLLDKWTPLTCKYDEEWIQSNSGNTRTSSNTVALESIPETEEKVSSGHDDNKLASSGAINHLYGSDGLMDVLNTLGSENGHKESQQEYFVPWHLPYHRAEIAGASSSALASGLATKDDKKGAVVYNRYYHVFVEGELERLAAGLKNVIIRDRFYDKSNWCIILEKI